MEELQKDIGRLEGKLDLLVPKVIKIEENVDKLTPLINKVHRLEENQEQIVRKVDALAAWRNYLAGAWAVIVAVGAWFVMQIKDVWHIIFKGGL